MPDKANLIVKNGTVATEDTTFKADVAITNGVISAIAAPGALDQLEADETYDASGKYVLPGVIDGHVHFREPGLEYKEDLHSGSRSAVMGGVTSVVDMPNTKPPTATPEVVLLKKKLIEEKSYTDVGVIGVFVQENLDQLQAMAEAGVVGYKVFLGETIGNIPAPDDGVMFEGLQKIAELGLRIGFHAENNELMQHLIKKYKAAGRTDPLAHVETRPVVAEVESIQRMGLFASYTGTKVHIFHLSSGPGLDMIDEWRAKGVNFTTETGAHYAFLTSEGPAKTWDIWPQKGALRVGSDGDLTLVDLNKEGVIHDADLHSKNHVTPFEGTKTKGAPVATILRGRVVMRDGGLVGESAGRMVRPVGVTAKSARQTAGATA
jgi:dihydroorotase